MENKLAEQGEVLLNASLTSLSLPVKAAALIV